MKYYLIYKITNLVNNKIYIGAHETFDKNDSYMGSGVAIKCAIAKYGIEAFDKIILEECDSYEHMYRREKELVTIGEHSYNLMPGGEGGWLYARSCINETSNTKRRMTCNSFEYKKRTEKIRNISSARMKKNNPMYDAEVREKQSKTLSATMHNPEWQNDIGNKRADAISQSIAELHAAGHYKNRDKKLSESRRGLRRAMLHDKKIWVSEDDPRINVDGFKFGWA